MDGEQAQPQPTASDFNPAPVDAGATDPANVTGMQATNEFGEPIVAEEVKELIPEEILEDMHNLWSVFAMENQDRVPISELRVIMRALDLDLDAKELAEVRKEIDPHNEGFIRFENLKKVMEGKLKEVDTYEDLIKEF